METLSMELREEELTTKLRQPRSLAERLFYGYLSRADRGSLRLKFRDTGEERVLGDASAAGPSLTVEDDRFFAAAVRYGEVGFGDAYVDGFWNTEDLTAVLSWFQKNAQRTPTFSANRGRAPGVNFMGFVNRIRHWMRRNTKRNSIRNISEHYDLSNEFFKLILDDTMAYSSAVFSGDMTLSEAQIQKFGVICRKLRLEPGMRVLEIGCGWGGFAAYAASQFGVTVDAVTISNQQYDFVKDLVKKRGLEDSVRPYLKDYRDLEGTYDRIVSIEMVEALGFEYMDTFFGKVNQLLASDGIFLMQAIFFPDPYYQKYLRSTDWTQKNIFPGSCLLSLHETMKTLDRTGDLIVWDVESLGPDYAKTLHLWRENLREREAEIRKLGMDDRFFRIWNYYFSFCEVGFDSRYINDMQLVISRPMNQALVPRAALSR